MFNNRALICFFEVAKTQNLPQAAKNLYLSISTLSYQIRNLEKELGFPLFYRQDKKMILTQSGEYYLKHVAKLQSAHEKIISQAKSIQSSSSLVIGFTEDMATNVYYKLESKFHDQYPHSNLQAIPVTYQDNLLPLISNTVDMMFTYKCRVSKQENIDFIQIATNSFYIGISKNSILANKHFVTVDDIIDKTILYCQEDLQWILNLLKNLKVDHIAKLNKVDFNLIIYNLIQNNQGISIFPYKVSNYYNDDIAFIPLKCDYNISKVLAWKNNTYNPLIEPFKDICKQVFKKNTIVTK